MKPEQTKIIIDFIVDKSEQNRKYLEGELATTSARIKDEIAAISEKAKSIAEGTPKQIDFGPIVKEVLNSHFDDVFSAKAQPLLQDLIPDPVPGEKGEKGEKGDKGDAGETPSIDFVKLVDDINKSLKPLVEILVKDQLPDLIPAPVKGEKGEDGKSIDEKEVLEQMELLVASLVEDRLPTLIPEPVKGDKGDKGDTPQVDYELIESNVRDDLYPILIKTVEDKLPELIPEPIKGDKGEKGDNGEGIDEEKVLGSLEKTVTNMVMDVLPGLIPDPIKGDDGEPGKDAQPPSKEEIEGIVRSIVTEDFVRKIHMEHATKIQHRGPYEDGARYYAGDEVMKDDGTWRAKRETTDAPPSDDWQCIAKSKIGKKGLRGSPGEKGDQGRPGKDGNDGVGIADVHISEDGELIFVFEDGRVKNLPIQSFLGKPIDSNE